ncbi:AAA family ATPase [Candidatus Sumerlaeota bacterium]|nr:AAA family ATPase [Candidatus Sumerlaeota bacterium]
MQPSSLSRLETQTLAVPSAPPLADSASNLPCEVVALLSRTPATGKTTCVVNLAAALARRERHVLVVDLDRAGFASDWLRPRAEASPVSVADGPALSIAEVLAGDAPAQRAVVETKVPLVDLIPASQLLARVEKSWEKVDDWEKRLARALDPLRSGYQFILIDCPPEISRVTTAALVAATGFIVPMIPHLVTPREFEEEMEVIAEAWEHSGSEAQLLGILMNQVKPERATENAASLMSARPGFFRKAFRTIILADQRLCACQSLRRVVSHELNKSPAPRNFDHLARELLLRVHGLSEDEIASEVEKPPPPPPIPPLGEDPEVIRERLRHIEEVVKDVELEVKEGEEGESYHPRIDKPLPETPPKGEADYRISAESERELFEMAAQQIGLPLTRLDDLQVTPDLIEALPAEAAQRLGVFPVAITEVGLRVAVSNPFVQGLQAELERITGGRVFLCLAPPAEVKRLIRRHMR